MRVFLSHSSYNRPLATYLVEALRPALGVSFFMLPDDAPHGMPWIEHIKLSRLCKVIQFLVCHVQLEA
jgi:hypothetical protein